MAWVLHGVPCNPVQTIVAIRDEDAIAKLEQIRCVNEGGSLDPVRSLRKFGGFGDERVCKQNASQGQQAVDQVHFRTWCFGLVEGNDRAVKCSPLYQAIGD